MTRRRRREGWEYEEDEEGMRIRKEKGEKGGKKDGMRGRGGCRGEEKEHG